MSGAHARQPHQPEDTRIVSIDRTVYGYAPERINPGDRVHSVERMTKVVAGHGRYVTFHLAEGVVSRDLFRNILSLIDDLRRRPAPA